MKIIKLIENETIKTLKKTSTIILIILSVLALFASVGFSKGITALSDMVVSYSDEEENWQDGLKTRIKYFKNIVENESKSFSSEDLANIKASLEIYEFALANKINYEHTYNHNYWKRQALDEIQTLRTSVIIYENTKYLSKEEKEDKQKLQERAEEKYNLIKDNDYTGYIELLKKEEKEKLDKKTIDEEEYNDNIYLLNIKEKYEIYKDDGKEYASNQSIYFDIETIKNSLRTGLNSNTGKLLKPSEIKDMENAIKIDEYKLEHNIPVVESMTDARTIYDSISESFSMLMISLLMIIIAGSSISTEISKGTIKFLLFTPNKRWKILLSKLLSAVLILISLAVILSLLSVVIGNMSFDTPGREYIYINNGEVRSISYVSYTILHYLASSIDVLVYMLFAFMLSVITRNTAFTVGLSVASYVGSGLVMNVINYYIKNDWIKYIPFNNMGIVDKIFTNTASYTTMQMASTAMNNVSIWFSLAVLGITSVLMIITMFDSFNKRDIV